MSDRPTAPFRGLQRVVAVIATLVVTLATANSAVAGTILLSGDSNTTDNLGVAGNEQLFFSNVLGSGTTVRVLDFTDAGYGSAGNTDTEVNNFYNSLAGKTSTLVSGTVTAATLAGANLFVVPLPDDNFSAGEVTAILGFLNGGGTLFLLGENNNVVFNTPNGAINQLLNDLGSTMDLVPAALSGPGTFAVDPFTAGLTDLRFIAGSQITGGKTLYTNDAGQGLIARQDIGTAATVPEPATLCLLGTGLVALKARRRLKSRG
jgi:hypothetical protein